VVGTFPTVLLAIPAAYGAYQGAIFIEDRYLDESEGVYIEEKAVRYTDGKVEVVADVLENIQAKQVQVVEEKRRQDINAALRELEDIKSREMSGQSWEYDNARKAQTIRYLCTEGVMIGGC